MTENRTNNQYRALTKALELVGFENATVRQNVATYSFNSRLSSFNCLDIVALENLCKDLKKQSEDDCSDFDFGLHQEVLLKGLMHFVQHLARAGKSVENINPDEITLKAIDNAIECAKNREAFIKQSKTVLAAGDPERLKNHWITPSMMTLWKRWLHVHHSVARLMIMIGDWFISISWVSSLVHLHKIMLERLT